MSLVVCSSFKFGKYFPFNLSALECAQRPQINVTQSHVCTSSICTTHPRRRGWLATSSIYAFSRFMHSLRFGFSFLPLSVNL